MNRWSRALAVGAIAIGTIALVAVMSKVMFGGHMIYPKYGYGMPGRMMDQNADRPMMKRGWSGDGAGSAETQVLPAPDAGFVAPIMPRSSSVMATERKVMSSASLDLRVANIQAMSDKVRETVTRAGGYVENATLSQPDQGVRTGWMTVRVPAVQFDTLFNELKGLAEFVANENRGTLDVTAEGINLSAALNQKRAEERAYVSLLERATKVSDVLEITQQLTRVRTEIEALESEQRTFESQTAMATISISLTEDPRVNASTGDFRRSNVLKTAVNELFQGLTRVGSGIIIFLIAGVPIFVAYLLILWVIYFFTKKGVNKFFQR